LAYEPNEKLVHYLAGAVRALPIALKLRTTANRENTAALNPDHIILATGARRVAPEIPGKAQRHVFDGDELRGILFGSNREAIAKLSIWQQLILTTGRWSQILRHITLMRLLSKLWMPITREVVIIGGGLIGLELAEYLVERKRKVTVLEPGPAFGPELAIVRRAKVLYELNANGAVLHKLAEDIQIGARSVSFSTGGEVQEIACGQVIIAMGAQPDDSLLKQLSDSTARVHQIGDCRRVGYIDGAILDARELVQRLESQF
jgi:2,4-dienoyl-CoA reductase (NADPH2)